MGRPELQLSIQYPAGKTGAPTRHQVRRWVSASCSVDAEITIRFVAKDEGRELNRTYRQKDYATNVLSFPYQQEDPLQGDLVICLPVVINEAQAQNKPLEAHTAHLIVHGMLHLQGYDHETDTDDAEEMESREREILGGLGYPDPYR